MIDKVLIGGITDFLANVEGLATDEAHLVEVRVLDLHLEEVLACGWASFRVVSKVLCFHPILHLVANVFIT